MSVIREVQEAVNRCVLNIDSSVESKVKAISDFLSQVDHYLVALEVNPDLSPRAFDATRNCRIQVG